MPLTDVQWVLGHVQLSTTPAVCFASARRRDRERPGLSRAWRSAARSVAAVPVPAGVAGHLVRVRPMITAELDRGRQPTVGSAPLAADQAARAVSASAAGDGAVRGGHRDRGRQPPARRAHGRGLAADSAGRHLAAAVAGQRGRPRRPARLERIADPVAQGHHVVGLQVRHHGVGHRPAVVDVRGRAPPRPGLAAHHGHPEAAGDGDGPHP